MTAIAEPLPPDIEDFRDRVLDFAEREVLPRHQGRPDVLDDPRGRYDKSGRLRPEVVELIREVRMASASAGLFTACVPEELGGGGHGHLAYYAGWQALFHRFGPRPWLLQHVMAHWAFGPSRLLSQLTERARERFLPGLMDGSKIMCFGLSEPGAGSDLSALATRAERDGDGWRIIGRKIWTTHGPIADYCVLFARTGEQGITAFIVPTDAGGFRRVRVVELFGDIGGDEAEIALEGLYVEPWQVIGEVDRGLAAALYGVSLGRVYNSARAVGTGRWAIETALAYAQEREAFGAPIAEYQGVSFPLAESATELHAAHLMGRNAARLLDGGSRAIKELSMTKAYSVQVGLRAVDRAMQTHGALGFTNDLGLTEAWKALRVVNVADGSNEILNRMIVRQLLRGDTAL
ncbi:MAG: acyl-CoA dehydrogenase [Holophagales bacterium]|nr:acyl-CoA dehydrogenase [Holophagales bacterium]MYC09461.1 acyl-CoA dehydrogenase [Holophagales bacterium]